MKHPYIQYLSYKGDKTMLLKPNKQEILFLISFACCILLVCIAFNSIKLTNNYVNEVELKAAQTNESLMAVNNSQAQEIASLQNEVAALQQVNEEQSTVIADQQATLDIYDQQFIDMHNEVDAYTKVLEEEAPKFQLPTTWDGPVSTPQNGGVMGPSGQETYYNLYMGNCIAKMRSLGYSEEEYPYWIRDDGAKMLGHYVMVAANWQIRPLGTILETSIGWGIVVDTGDFVEYSPRGIDLAVDW